MFLKRLARGLALSGAGFLVDQPGGYALLTEQLLRPVADLRRGGAGGAGNEQDDLAAALGNGVADGLQVDIGQVGRASETAGLSMTGGASFPASISSCGVIVCATLTKGSGASGSLSVRKGVAVNPISQRGCSTLMPCRQLGADAWWASSRTRISGRRASVGSCSRFSRLPWAITRTGRSHC